MNRMTKCSTPTTTTTTRGVRLATRLFFTLILIVLSSCTAPTVASDDNRVMPKPARRKMIYVCPPEFIRRGNQCYFLSTLMATWQDAHYNCKDKHSELIILDNESADRHLRNYLNKPELARVERWIGGRYSWMEMLWTWGNSGQPMRYNGFPKKKQNETAAQLQWQCVILDPGLNYKWDHRSCVEGKHYICQRPLEKVTKAGRRDYRKKLNMTNPNQKLNEIPVPPRYPHSSSRRRDQRPPKFRKPSENRINNESTPQSEEERHQQRRPRPSAHNLKAYQPNGIQRDDASATTAFGHRSNHTTLSTAQPRQNRNGHMGRTGRTGRIGRQGRQQRIRNRCRNRDAFVNRHVGEHTSEDECVRILLEQWRRKHLRKQRRAKGSVPIVENITHKTLLLSPKISDIHPQQIAEVHDF